MIERREEVPATVQPEAPGVPRRKPWSAPTLTVHAVDAVTKGLNASTRIDGGNFFS